MSAGPSLDLSLELSAWLPPVEAHPVRLLRRAINARRALRRLESRRGATPEGEATIADIRTRLRLELEVIPRLLALHDRGDL